MLQLCVDGTIVHMSRRAQGSNQYRTIEAADVPVSTGVDLMAQAAATSGQLMIDTNQQPVQEKVEQDLRAGHWEVAKREAWDSLLDNSRQPSLSQLEYRERYAANPRTPPDVLDQLAQDPYPPVRVAAAKNPLCPISTASRLARDADPRVRIALAANPFCPQTVLDQMAGGTDREACLAIANRGETLSVQTELALAASRDRVVRTALARRVRLHKEAADVLAQDVDLAVRVQLAQSTGLLSVIEMMARDRDPLIRRAAASNPNRLAVSPVLAELAEDEEATVQAAARANRHYPPRPPLWATGPPLA